MKQLPCANDGGREHFILKPLGTEVVTPNQALGVSLATIGMQILVLSFSGGVSFGSFS